MNEAPASTPGIFRRLGRFGSLGLLLIALLASGFAAELLFNSQAVVGSFERQNTHDLAVIAQILESRQLDFKRLAKASYDTHGGAGGQVTLPHPDLGSIHIFYGCKSAATTDSYRLFPRSSTPEDDDQYSVSGEVTAVQGRAAGRPVGKTDCYTVRVSLKRLVSLASTAPSLTNALIVSPDGTVLEQLGQDSLPIAKLPQLEAEPALTDDLPRTLLSGSTAPAPQKPRTIELAASAGIARLTINDEEYRGYIRPFRLTVPPDVCRSAAADARLLPTASDAPARAPASAAVAPATTEADAGDPSALAADCQLYLVGLTPTAVSRSASLTPPKLALVSFILALAFVVMLLPLCRLLLINHTETISALGVLVIVLGLVAASAIATAGLLFVGEMAAERRLAVVEARDVARDIAASTGHEIDRLDRAARACRGDQDAGRSTPTVVDASYIERDGTPTKVALSCPAKQITVGSARGRAYLEALRRLPPKSDDYVLDQLVGQTDGLDKTVLARHGTAQDWPPDRFAIRVSTVIRSLIAPTLPPPEKFMVVDTGGDTGSDELRVLFHSRRSRAGIENLADQIEQPTRVATQLRHLVADQRAADDPDPQTTAFVSRYDGVDCHFTAASIPGSNWVVLIYYPFDKVDATAARTTFRSLLTWASLSILVVIAIGLIWLFAPRDAWRVLWPAEERIDPASSAAEQGGEPRHGADVYLRLAAEGALVSVAIVIGAVLTALAGPHRWFAIIPVLALAAAAAFVVHVFRRLRARRCSAEPLARRTGRAYLRFFLALLVCTGVAPMVAVWVDARGLSRAEDQIERTTAASAAHGSWTQRLNALGALVDTKALPVTWLPRDVTVPATRRSEDEVGLSAQMLWLESGVARATFDRCDRKAELPAGIGAAAGWFCAFEEREVAIERPWATPPLLGWMVVVILATALAIIIHTAVAAALEALTGFGMPLGAVTWPKLLVDEPSDPEKNRLELTKKALLVAPQQAVRDRLAMLPGALPINFADQLLSASEDMLRPVGDDPPRVPTSWRKTDHAQGSSTRSRHWLAWLTSWIGGGERTDPQAAAAPDTPGVTLIVSGIELVLRDALRRRAALAYLERAVSVLAIEGQQEIARVIVIAEMSPLERILDAFESFADNDEVRLSTREELRWARLFQHFSTFHFAPIDKVADDELDRDARPPTGATRTLINELRWLPGTVIDGVIADHSSRDELTRAARGDDKSFPLAAEAYRAHYTPLIRRWAVSLNATSEEAVVDYMRAHLIEYYEQCWSASSFAERIILDAIARHSFINMRKAVALQSLVRRGLVILDPAPRLMNESFALYLRQSERPDTLARWKALQPRSAWSTARLPLALLLPALLVLLAIAAVDSGQSLSALFPLLAGALPAVVGLLVRSAKKP